MRLHYNSPVVLTFTLLAMVVLAVDPLTDYTMMMSFFTVLPGGSLADPMTWFRIFSHVLGHANWEHLLGNFAIILLIGPILEEKYGSARLLVMMLFTAFVTGLIVTLFFRTALLGASGIAFMMILLGSFANTKAGKIPLTFIFVAVIYLGREIFTAFSEDQISQMAHIIGGVMGGAFGFFLRPRDSSPTVGGTKPPPARIKPPTSSTPPPKVHTSSPDSAYGSNLSPEALRYGLDDD